MSQRGKLRYYESENQYMSQTGNLWKNKNNRRYTAETATLP